MKKNEGMNGQVEGSTLLHKLMETNDNIILIKDLAFQIKLKSINEQILAIRNDLSETGFQVVSREFIGFSKNFEELADEMQLLMDEMLIEISQSLKKLKYETLKQKANSLSGKIYFPDSEEKLKHINDFNREMRLKKAIQRASLLSLKGNNIFIQSKITGAYIKEHGKQNLVNSLISELGTVMEKVRLCTTTIKKIWN